MVGWFFANPSERYYTPENSHGTQKNWWLVDVSPFPRGVFSGSMLVFRGVVKLDHETPGIGMEMNKYLSCHHLVLCVLFEKKNV